MKNAVCIALALVLALSCCSVVLAEEDVPSISKADGATVFSKLSELFDNIKSFTNENWDSILSYLQLLWEKAQSYLGGAADTLSLLFGDASGSVEEIWTTISDFIRGIFGQVSALVA